MPFKQLFLKYRLSISILLLFVLIENVAWIIEPTFFGKLLDGLIDHFYDHEKVNYVTPLFIWIFVYLLNVIAGAFHRFYNGGVYSKMHADIATDVIVESELHGDPLSKVLARTELVKEYITFFKDRIPEALWQLSASVGAIIALFFYDYRIALVCLAVIGPIAYINNYNRKKNAAFQKDIHDNQVELYNLIELKDTSKIHQFYFNMIEPKTKMSHWNSYNHVIVKTLLVIIFVAVLFICVDVDKFTTGTIYSIVAYLWTFIVQTDYLPELMESLGSVKDLNDRFKMDHSTEEKIS
jgi:ABC-type multidrug transport system fused ATPase/permease subunit